MQIIWKSINTRKCYYLARCSMCIIGSSIFHFFRPSSLVFVVIEITDSSNNLPWTAIDLQSFIPKVQNRQQGSNFQAVFNIRNIFVLQFFLHNTMLLIFNFMLKVMADPDCKILMLFLGWVWERGWYIQAYLL